MATSFKAFDRVVSFAPGSADTKWIEAELARLAKASLGEAQGDGSASEAFTRAVNGRLNAPEESVTAPGPIVYSFEWLSDAAVYAIAWLKTASPVRSGRYRRSFICVADGREVPPEALTTAERVIVVNTQPYSRKIQVGASGFESRRGLYDRAARAVRREFRGLVAVRVTFVSLSGAYTLKRSRGRRRDRAAGAPLNYPALELMSETAVRN